MRVSAFGVSQPPATLASVVRKAGESPSRLSRLSTEETDAGWGDGALPPALRASASTSSTPRTERGSLAHQHMAPRAERIGDCHTARELVILLVDLVSRGGNLLLDIGPAADGTIPVIMEERLLEIGSWLKVNGEAIYGTKPFKVTRQWSEGEVPATNYNQEFNSNYDVTKLTEKPAPGKAAIEAFFTSKGANLYVILPRWPGHRFTVKDFDAAGLKSATLLGAPAPLRFQAQTNALTIELPDPPEDLLSQPAWVIKLSK